MSFRGGYRCWWMKKPRGSYDTAERPSIDPSVDEPSIDPPAETAENPSTDPPDRSIDLPVENAKKTCLSTTSIGSPPSTKPPSLEEVVSNFKKVGIAGLDDFIDVIKQLLERLTAQKDDFFKSGEATKIVGDILQQIGHFHWIVGSLSVIGYLISKCQNAYQNRTECVVLLKGMLTLASHIKHFNILILENEKKKQRRERKMLSNILLKDQCFVPPN